MAVKVLIVEDEVKLASLLVDYLKADAISSEQVVDGGLAMASFKSYQPDVVLLDLMLPNVDGLTLCKQIRAISNVPIIITTARVDEIDRLLGLELGADDYVCKPYSPREVVARVKAMMRRLNYTEPSESSRLTLDANTMLTHMDGQVLDLTHVEFQLLSIMSKELGRIFSRPQLMERMYQDQRVVSDRTIDSHIKKLRKKVAELRGEEEWIHSVYGVGYKLEIPPRN